MKAVYIKVGQTDLQEFILEDLPIFDFAMDIYYGVEIYIDDRLPNLP